MIGKNQQKNKDQKEHNLLWNGNYSIGATLSNQTKKRGATTPSFADPQYSPHHNRDVNKKKKKGKKKDKKQQS